jgi:hypothetical protein
MDDVMQAWQKVVNDGVVEQYGCYEYYEDVPSDSIIKSCPEHFVWELSY